MDTYDLFEEEIARNPYYLNNWLQYLTALSGSRPMQRYMVYERAVKYLPRSYKLWYAYISELMERLEHKSITDKRNMLLMNVLERCLVHLHKMPLIW